MEKYLCFYCIFIIFRNEENKWFLKILKIVVLVIIRLKWGEVILKVYVCLVGKYREVGGVV